MNDMVEPIPKNIDDTGGILGGLVETRNAIEAVIAAGVSFFVSRLCFFFLSDAVRPLAALTVALCIGGFFVFGINHQPVSIAVLDYINYRKTRCVVTLHMPMPDLPTKTKHKIKIKIKKKR